MTPVFRLVLLAGALLVFAYVLRKIRKSEMKIADSTFWFLFGLGIVILAVFPSIAFFFSNLLNVQSPSNFVFLFFIAVLVVREFSSSVKISQLSSKLAILTQEIALRDAKLDELESRGVERGAGAAASASASDGAAPGDLAEPARQRDGEGADEPCSR